MELNRGLKRKRAGFPSRLAPKVVPFVRRVDKIDAAVGCERQGGFDAPTRKVNKRYLSDAEETCGEDFEELHMTDAEEVSDLSNKVSLEDQVEQLLLAQQANRKRIKLLEDKVAVLKQEGAELKHEAALLELDLKELENSQEAVEEGARMTAMRRLLSTYVFTYGS